MFYYKNRLKIFVGIVIALLGIMGYSAISGGNATVIEKVLSFISSPFQKASASVSNASSEYFSKYTKYEETQKENEELQKEVDELRKKVIDYDDIKQENVHLKNLSGIREANPDFQFASASIIGRDPENRDEVFTIDCGYAQGVSIHDPVITEHGIVGWVEKTGPGYAVVTTILSPKLKVGVYDTATEQIGVLIGDLNESREGNCILTYLEEKPEEGSLIVTTGSSGLFPRGLVIGTVENTELQNSGTSYYAVIKPANKISELKHVVVLTDFLGQGEGMDSQSAANETE